MIVHFAGASVRLNDLLRQRCAWCGQVLIDYDLSLVSFPVGTEREPSTWPAGKLVAVDGNMSYTMPHEDGQLLPPESCALAELGAAG